MDDSWRFRPIQRNTCPPPPAAYPDPPPYPNPFHNPVRDPTPLLNQFQYQLDGSRKRMRVEDPNPLLPPARTSADDEWRLNMIRDYGRHDTHRNTENFRNPGFNSLSSSDSHYGSYYRPPLEYKTNPYEFKPNINSMPYGSSNNGYRYAAPPIENTFEPTFNSSRHYYGSNNYDGQASQAYYPPLPPNPPPPEPSPPSSYNPDKPLVRTPPPPDSKESLFPIAPSSQSVQASFYGYASTPLPVVNSQSLLDSHPMVRSDLYNEMGGHASTEFTTKTSPFMNHTPSSKYMEGKAQTSFIHHTPSNGYIEARAQTLPPKHVIKDDPFFIDACQLFKNPHRASRPDHIVIILRGLPGSGKSYTAKALRDLEVESGGNAPRIHSMDDYFMIEVEKKVENEGSKSSASFRGKKQITKKVIEYCYEPEMEEVYRSSMLKAFQKTLDEGNYTFVIVDDRNLRVADFAQFWAIAKRSGYEVYLLEATYKDPIGCAARNVHGFTEENIQKMAEQWEEAPSLYLQLDIHSLFRGDNLREPSIQEVDMDTDDAGCDDEEPYKLHPSEHVNNTEPKVLNHSVDGYVKIGERWNDEEEEDRGVIDLKSSKWSKDVDEDEDNSEAPSNSSALSGLKQAYSKNVKSVHWGDQDKKSGFSIGVAKKRSGSSIIIGPGSGYNLSSNPLLQNDDTLQQTGNSSINESKRRFTEQLRAERESFKAVFDKKRRQRIGGLRDSEDE